MNKESGKEVIGRIQPDEDTIAAIATPIGRAGIGIIRISGPASHKIARDLFRPKNNINKLDTHRLYLGQFLDSSSGCLLDECLLSYMKAPHSYTREDVIEINSHSGYLLLSKILQAVLDRGARLARPGEFTLRAFLNGRIDLTQAEAVMDLINSQSEKGLDLASQQIQGSFRKEIDGLRQRAVDMLAHAEVAIDFPEEDSGLFAGDAAAKKIRVELIRPIEDLIKAHARKRIWVDGINTAIVGRVNAGKSSLLNILLNEQRAIVTPVPGTTRDIIESTITIGGVPLRLADTAGIRKVKDEVEKIGIDLSSRRLNEADFLLLVMDQSRPLNHDDMHILDRSRGKKVLVVINKIDLPTALESQALEAAISEFPSVRISALTGEGMEQLRKAIVECLLDGDTDLTGSHATTNIRHGNALKEAAQCFRDAASETEKGSPLEIIAFELKNGLDAMGEIIGDTATEEVLESIFSRFCLGK